MTAKWLNITSIGTSKGRWALSTCTSMRVSLLNLEIKYPWLLMKEKISNVVSWQCITVYVVGIWEDRFGFSCSTNYFTDQFWSLSQTNRIHTFLYHVFPFERQLKVRTNKDEKRLERPDKHAVKQQTPSLGNNFQQWAKLYCLKLRFN